MLTLKLVASLVQGGAIFLIVNKRALPIALALDCRLDERRHQQKFKPMSVEFATYFAAELEDKLRTLCPDRVLKYTAIDHRVFRPQSDS